MTDPNSPDELRSLWQDQPVAPFQMSPDELRLKMQHNYQQFKIWYHPFLYYVLSAAMIFAGYNARRNGNSSAIAGIGLLSFLLVYMGLRIRRYAQDRKESFTQAEALGNAGSLAFYRSVLEQQLKFDRSLHWIRFLVFPLFVFLQIAIGFKSPSYLHRVPDWVFFIVFDLAYLLALVLVWRHDLKEERKCQRKIEALGGLLRAPE